MTMGMDDRPPATSELDAMIALLEDGLRAGALGMSSGLFTPPGSYAAPAEMQAFGHVLKRHNAGYFTHLRDESNKVLEAVAEAMSLLPEEQRTAIILKEYHGMTFQEIADLQGCPLSTVKTRLYQGLAVLRRSLEQSGRLVAPQEKSGRLAPQMVTLRRGSGSPRALDNAE